MAFSKPVGTVASLFSGIAGIERGMARAGWKAELFCESDESARRVLAAHFPDVTCHPDIRTLRKLPKVDVVTAGFPCQDLSQCGKVAGIEGDRSSLVGEVFRLLETAKSPPNWVVFENVPFMLSLQRGKAIRSLTTRLRELGYRWAYRTVDAKAFGLPQRRHRVFIVAARVDDPRSVLFADNEEEPAPPASAAASGFSWTEGNTGLGWAEESVPTLKGGSGLGIPSPPAVWVRETGEIGTIDVQDAERLQGFPAGWTRPGVISGARSGTRWRLVGNAVCVRVAEWVGRRIARPGKAVCRTGSHVGEIWPKAAFDVGEGAVEVVCSRWPVCWKQPRLLEFLRFHRSPLSWRASSGFFARASSSRLTFANGFLSAVERHVERMHNLT